MKIPENFDRWIFDYFEGNLTPAEASEFERFLELNPDFEADADAWQHAVIEDESIEYPGIQNLERKRKFVGTWYGWSAAASLLLLVLSGGYYLTTSSNESLFAAREFVITNELMEHSATKNSAANDASDQEHQDASLTADQMQFQTVNTVHSSKTGSHVFKGSTLTSSHLDKTNGSSSTHSQPKAIVAHSEQSHKAHIKGDDLRVQQELLKFDGSDFAGQYQNNPTQSDAEINVAKKNNTNFNSFGAVTKRIYRKLEKMMGYPVGIVNMRDQELLTPENNLVASNPGFTGSMLKPRLEMSYRNQWLGSTEFLQKSSINFDDYVESIRGGFGFSINSAIYNNGGFADHSVDFRYSPKVVISPKVVFEPAIKVTIGMMSASTAKLGTNQHVELDRGLLLNATFETLSAQTNSLLYKDYGVGFVLNLDKFYVGASADNLNRHYANIYLSEGQAEPTRTPVLLNGIAGFDYVSNTRPFSLSPFVSIRKFGDFTEAWGGMTMRLNYFTLGGSCSTSQNYAASIGLKFEKFKLTYQYDVTQSLYTLERMGSHNLGIRFNGGGKKHITNRR